MIENRAFFSILAAVLLCLALIAFSAPNASSTSVVKFTQLTTARLNEILQDDSKEHPISSLKLGYFDYIQANNQEYYGKFTPKPRQSEEREWYFTLMDYNGQKYEMLVTEASYRSLLSLSVVNEICEMQSVMSENFNKDIDYWQIWISRYGAEALIGYNVRDAESEPFFEVVDYIEENFVTPALLNPVDDWWWKR